MHGAGDPEVAEPCLPRCCSCLSEGFVVQDGDQRAKIGDQDPAGSVCSGLASNKAQAQGQDSVWDETTPSGSDLVCAVESSSTRDAAMGAMVWGPRHRMSAGGCIACGEAGAEQTWPTGPRTTAGNRNRNTCSQLCTEHLSEPSDTPVYCLTWLS